MKNLLLFLSMILFATAQYSKQNAAIIYWKASALTTSEVWEQNDNSSSFAKLTEEGKLDNLFKQNSQVVVEVIKASKLSYCRFILPCEYEEGPNILLPHLGKMMGLCRFVVLSGRHYALKKQWQQAAECYIAAMRFSSHLGQDPFLITSLVSYATIGMSLSAIRKTIINKDFPNALREKIKGTLKQVSSQMHLGQAFNSEAKIFIEPFRKQLQKNDISTTWDIIKQHFGQDSLFKKKPQQVFSTKKDREELALLLKAKPSFFTSKQSFAKYILQAFDLYTAHAYQMTNICKSSYKSGMTNYLKLQKEVEKSHFFVNFLSPMKTYETQLRAYANVNMTILLLELLSYNNSYNKFPTSLDDLNQQIEFYSLQDFTYTKIANGFHLEIVIPITNRKFIYKVSKERNSFSWDFIKYLEEKIEEQEKSKG
ncbi:hypothetical protein [Candidatus Uabimicrobium sp. HlEnr_7]|uniref:hypothetical protein n=1 Tax=Candidatus Uabimicrobium helgolandensis TaxID=3095367 RepID=UPI0035563186